jgi:hypothetical protein
MTGKTAEFYEYVRKIREIKEQGKLVVFVGAGVSKNSGLPSWGELVGTFAKELGYKNKVEVDNYLKIPQYVFNKSEALYEKILEENFSAKALENFRSNGIHEAIFNLDPAHIITTNYDNLIENSENEKSEYYTVISSDRELLEKGAEAKKYILKMHGDYNDLKNIVFKEDDYLRYEQQYVLISTFIKSLLANHAFLFVGYGINDYNFKQIIDWIEYLSDRVGAVKDKMPKHFVIKAGDKPITKYEKKYLHNKHIEVLEADNLSSEYISKANKNLKSKPHNVKGRQLLAVINALEDETSDFDIAESSTKVIKQRLSVFDDFKFIAYNDLIKVLKFKNCYCEPTGLIPGNDDINDINRDDMIFGFNMLKFSNLSEFEKLVSACQEAPEINEYFERAGFFAAYSSGDPETKFIFIKRDYEDENESLFKLYLDNDYIELKKQAVRSKNQRVRVYYQWLLSSAGNISESMINDFKILASRSEYKSDYYNLIDRLNLLAGKSYMWGSKDKDSTRKTLIDFFESLTYSRKNNIRYLYDWFVNSESEKLSFECVKKLDRHENFIKSDSMWKSNPWDDMFDIAQKVSCFYKMIKLNGVILDGFSETNTLFWAYSRAVLCTYKFHLDLPEEEKFIPTDESGRRVKLDEETLDIIIKYSKYKELKYYIFKNHLRGFRYNSNINIINKFANLIKSFLSGEEGINASQIKEYITNFCLLLRNSELTEAEEKEIIETISKVLDYRCYFITTDIKFQDLFYELTSLICKYDTYQVSELILRLLDWGGEEEIARKLVWFFGNFYGKSSETVRKEIKERIIFRQNEFANYSKWIFILNDLLPMTDNDELEIRKRFEKEKIPKMPGVKSMPDPMLQYLKIVVHLHLNGKLKNISFLEEVFDKYSFLKAIFDVEKFDVEDVDFRANIWCAIFENETYRNNIFSIGGNKEKIRVKLANMLNNEIGGPLAQKIYYLYFQNANKD